MVSESGLKAGYLLVSKRPSFEPYRKILYKSLHICKSLFCAMKKKRTLFLSVGLYGPKPVPPLLPYRPLYGSKLVFPLANIRTFDPLGTASMRCSGTVISSFDVIVITSSMSPGWRNSFMNPLISPIVST